MLGFLLVLGNTFASSKETDWPKTFAEEYFHITEVMVTDVASPPVAARIYAYTSLAAYLVSKSQGAQFQHQSLLEHTYLSGHTWNISNHKIHSPEFAAILAFMKVGKAIMPSGYLLEGKQQDWIAKALKAKIVSKKTFNPILT
ncbi:hypothetical protein V8V91_25050 [Algoriphagus halophilus]|uniref:hypothetical protein n=1 Tax=Algoriphagus halophilus TaxID=226505 RepID=UPI0035900F18